MKKIIFLFVFIQSIVFYGQEEAPKRPKFVASDTCGILYYEAEETAEVIKVKADTDQFYDMAKALRQFNGKVKEVAFLNTHNFKKLDVIFNRKPGNTENTVIENDPEIVKKKKEESVKLLQVVPLTRKKIAGFEKTLNEKMKTILKEKQLKKWLKYQKKRKRSLEPERPRAPSNGAQNLTGPGSSLGQGGGINNRGRF